MTLPDLSATAKLDTAPWSKGIDTVLRDLRGVADLSKKVGTIRLGIELGQGVRDAQRATRQIGDAMREAVSPMQGRISQFFGEFTVGANSARQSAAVFEAQSSALRARIDELSRAVAISRSNFQAGLGEAAPQEVAELSIQMNKLSRELEEVGKEARENFGEYSREAQKVANANRLAQVTAAAARGEISRLGLASQVKLGTSAALQQYGGQANFAANGIFQLALSSDKARIAQGLFNKTVEKTGQSSSQAAQSVKTLQDTLGVTEDAAREGLRGLMRQKYSLEEAQKALIGAGASALAAGRSAQEGMDAYVDAITAGSSARLNEIGISENLSTFYQKEAKARDTTVDGLDRQAKIQAELNLITAATSDEVGDLTALLGGAAGGMNSINREFSEAGKELGQTFIPLVTNGIRHLTAFLDWFNEAPPVIKETSTVLLATAVAIGVLGVPVMTFVNAMKSGVEWIGKYRTAGKAAAEVGEALNATAKAGAFTRMLDWVKASPASWAAYRTSVLAASGANNIFAASSLKIIGTNLLTWLTATTVGVGVFAAAIAAAAALGAYWVVSVRQITETYEQADKANEESFNRIQKRIQELNAQGTELSRAQARYLNAVRGLSDAQAGTPTGKINWITGEREIKVDAEAVKYWQAQLAKAKTSLDALAQQRQAVANQGPVLKKLTDDETKAFKELGDELSKRAKDYNFQVKLQGKTEFQKDLLDLGRSFDELRDRAREIFKGTPNDPRLKNILDSIQAEQNLQELGLRKKYADDAVKAAQESARAVQKAELDAMQDGRAKKAAERKLEIEELQRANKEEADQYKDFPEQYKKIVADGQREVAALKRKHRQEDIATAEDHARRIKEAEARAAQSVLDTMQDGYAKQELARRLALDQLKSDIAERVRALEGDPAAQAKVKSEGQKEINNRIQADNLARLKEVQDAQAAIRDAELAGADARVAALADGFAKEEAVRALALVKLKDSYQKRIDAEKGRPDVQKALMGERDDAVASLETQNAQARTAAIKAGNDAVYEAQKAARAAENALIKDDLAKKQAAQNEEFSDLERSIQKKLEGFKGTEEQRRKILEAGQAQVRALNKKHIQEDADDAKERARRIAQAWQEVQEKQFAAQQAARERELAQFDAQQARIQRSFTGDPVRQAGAAGDAIPQRYQLEEQLAAKQYAADRQRLENTRKFALDTENLTADQKRIIWENYYADLKKLDEGYQKGRVDAAARKDQEQADALERVRQTMLARGQEALEPLAARRQELEWARDLATTDTERLRITKELQGVIAQQVTGQENLLKGSAGALPNDQERKQINQAIATLQHDQTSNLKTQKDLTKSVADEQQRILRSSLARLEAEAGFAEKYARTDADLLNARQKSMEAYRKQLAQVNAELVKSGGDTEKTNELLDQRDTIMGKLLDKQKEIDAMPGEAEQRRLGVMQAQRGLMLEMAGLQDNAIAQAQERARAAQEEYQFALKTLATKPEGSADYDKAKQDALQKQTGLLSAQRALVKARVDEEARALDLHEAQARAQLTFNDLADDAVATAELELDITRRRLSELNRNVARGTAGPDAERDRVNLLKQQTEQERTLTRAQEDRRRLLESVVEAQRNLNAELDGGYRRATPLQAAFQGLADARDRLAKAEQDYQEAQAKGKPEKIKEATDNLTSAIKGQRDAVEVLAQKYRDQLAAMNDVQAAAAGLKNVLEGSTGGRFDANREIDRFYAIQQRRDAILARAQEAMRKGDRKLLAESTKELTAQQDRYERQAALIEKNGLAISRSKTRAIADFMNQLDLTGIRADREADLIQQRAEIVDREAAAVMQFGEHVGQFSQAMGGGLKSLTQQIAQVKPSEISYLYDGQRFSSLAERDAWIRSQEARPTTQPAPQLTVHNNFYATINATSDKTQDIERAARRVFNEVVSDVIRGKSWSPPCR